MHTNVNVKCNNFSKNYTDAKTAAGSKIVMHAYLLFKK